MASNAPVAPSPVALDWGAVVAGLLNPTVLTSALAGAAAILIGARHTFGVPVDQDLVYLGLGLLGGTAITHRS